MPEYSSGPIVACDKAIAHYEKVYRQQTEQTDERRGELARSLDLEHIYDQMLRQWQDAKAVLLQALGEDDHA